jgi:hypothetical protein
MTDRICPFEAWTAEAVKTGRWSDELRSHLAGCAVCEETRTVAALLNRAAEALGRTEPAPDPTLIWLKAELARRNGPDRRDRKIWLWSGALSGVAATVTAWVSLKWIVPVVALDAGAFAMGGGAIAFTLGILYFTVYRPLRNVGR